MWVMGSCSFVSSVCTLHNTGCWCSITHLFGIFVFLRPFYCLSQPINVFCWVKHYIYHQIVTPRILRKHFLMTVGPLLVSLLLIIVVTVVIVLLILPILCCCLKKSPRGRCETLITPTWVQTQKGSQKSGLDTIKTRNIGISTMCCIVK